MKRNISGYQVCEIIKESAKSVVYRAIRDKDKQAVAIKTPRDEYPSHHRVARFRHEFVIHQNLAEVAGVVDIFELIEFDNKPALVMEYVSGGELFALLKKQDDDFLDCFFKLAIQITHTVGAIHQSYIIHKDLNPRNILWEPNSETIKIIDFGIATELSREKQNYNTTLLKGSLPYMSPEQTGRMNRSIDYRSDFYSLGATFYALLTGELPYHVDDDNDVMSWVHCHIALQPKPLFVVNSSVSSALSAIIFKLMEKNAEDRYQSAYGLITDLETCYEQWQKQAVIGEIIPGLQDISDHFEIQQKLYGREQEVNELMGAFSDISEGVGKMFLVSGFSGIGKSALINEVHKPIIIQQGYFISGKFDQFQRNIPYSAMANAFRGLMKQLLADTQDNLKQWKQQLLEILGPNGQVLIDFIPELEQIIGPQRPVPHLGTEENQNRFNGLALQFLLLFTRKERPLVLFLDDLQWVDSASLNLIKLFMQSKEHRHFLFIGAYRNNEVDEHHPFMLLVNELKKAEVPVSDLILEPLKLEHINTLVSESLHMQKQKSLPLARLVMDKTAGNPFFINQFLRNTFEIGLLSFDVKRKSWGWDLERIKQQQSSANVVDLVVLKMQRLPLNTRHLLTLAACIGNQFDLQMLSIISELSLVRVASELWPALQAGLLLSEGDGHILLKGMSENAFINARDFPLVLERFLHDRVQQAAYSLISEKHKQQVHLKIARLLLEKIPEHELENHYFDIVEHYNKSINLLTDDLERKRLSELNVQVGIKAKQATAYAPALQYFKQAAYCLEKMDSRQYARLFFEIDKGRIECYFLLSDSEQGLQLAAQVLARCERIEDKVELNNILILHYGGAGQMDKAIDIALTSLRYFAIDLPRNPNKVQLLIELARAKLSLGRKSTTDLMQLPVIQEKNIEIVFSLLKELIAPTYLQGLTNLLPYIILRMFNLTLDYGNGAVSAFTYSAYALLWAKLDDFEAAYRFGVLAMDYNKKIDNPPMEARCYFMATSFALYWQQPFRDLQEPRKNGLQKLINTGEYFWASYINLFGFWQEVVLSKSIADLLSLSKREMSFAQKAKQTEPYYVHLLHRNLLMNFAGLTASSDTLDVEIGEEQRALGYFASNKTSTTGKFYHVVCRLVLFYYHEQYQQAIDIATQPDINEDVIRDGTYTRVMYTFFTCLAILALASFTFKPSVLHKHYPKRRQKIEQWFVLFPENFSCMWRLILAEEARIEGQDGLAMDYFQQALFSAKQNQSLFFESLVNELYAKFWLQRDNQKVASVYMLEAAYLYYRWGAEGKLSILKGQYQSLLKQHDSVSSAVIETLSTEDSYTDSYSNTIITNQKESTLDINTLVKASQALSGELKMEKLLQKLMHFLLENAGAQKGILLLIEQGELFVETQCLLEQDEVLINDDIIALDDCVHLSQAIVRYVARSKELLVLGDAAKSQRFAADAYLQAHVVKSILCLPLLHKNSLSGVLYLENNLANNTFTPDRVETLQVISAEITIALENARLYRNLEEYNQTLEETVKQRTAVLRSVNETLQTQNVEIQQSKQIIEEKSSNITKSIQYAKKIQQAMLPHDQRIAEQLTDFFIIFKPKQIVSGDFYWFNHLDGIQFLIVADCTGHGVPGAFLSMIGNMLLNKIIIEKRVFSPAMILGILHEEMRRALQQEGKTRQTNDGMDVAVCQIDLNKHVLMFAGARRPLYIHQNKRNKLLKIAGDRKSIGGRQKEPTRRFTEHAVRFSDTDMLYLCSDGLVDQHNVGGKKFGSLQLETLLQNVVLFDAEKQKQQILNALHEHQGKELQRDDITLFGLRLKGRYNSNNNRSQQKMMESFDLLRFRQEIIENDIVLSFEGKMSQGVLVSLVDTLKQKLMVEDQDTTQHMIRKIFAIFVELAQNIQNHSMENVLIDGVETGVGIIVIREDENSYLLTSGNNVSIAHAEKLKQYCDELNSFNADELKKAYKEQLRVERNRQVKGAGIGLIDIIRKSGGALKYEIQAVDEQTKFYSLSVNLSKV